MVEREQIPREEQRIFLPESTHVRMSYVENKPYRAWFMVTVHGKSFGDLPLVVNAFCKGLNFGRYKTDPDGKPTSITAHNWILSHKLQRPFVSRPSEFLNDPITDAEKKYVLQRLNRKVEPDMSLDLQIENAYSDPQISERYTKFFTEFEEEAVEFGKKIFPHKEHFRDEMNRILNVSERVFGENSCPD